MISKMWIAGLGLVALIGLLAGCSASQRRAAEAAYPPVGPVVEVAGNNFRTSTFGLRRIQHEGTPN